MSYLLYVDVKDCPGIRFLKGKQAGTFSTYEDAKNYALEWIKDHHKTIMDIQIIFDGDIKSLEYGKKYSMCEALQSFKNDHLYFEDIEIKLNPYNIYGIFKGTSKHSLSNKERYIAIENNKSFYFYGKDSLGSSCNSIMEENAQLGKWVVAVNASAMHIIDYSGTKMYEFDTREEAMQRLTEMVLAGWDIASTIVWFESDAQRERNKYLRGEMIK